LPLLLAFVNWQRGVIVLKWLAMIFLVTVLLIAIRVFFEIDRNITSMVWFFIVMSLSFLHYYFEVICKPLVHAKRVKVIKSWAAAQTIHNPYRIKFLFQDKKTLDLMVSKKQIYAVKKNEIVDIIYQGMLVRSIKKHPGRVMIFYDELSQIKIEKNADKILTYEQAMKGKLLR